MFLATTANQKYWETDKKILFLGEWCKVYSEKHIWSNLDHETLPSNWGKYHEWDSHRIYVEEIYEKYLKVLASNLNNCHNEDHSLKYWRVIIGPWLIKFIIVIYDRYLSIKSAIDSHKVTSTWIPYPKPEQWVPVGTYDFLELSVGNDNFNLYLYGRLIVKLGKIPFKFIEDESFFNPLFSGKNIRSDIASSPLKKIKHDLVAEIIKIVPDRFYKIVFCSSGLSKWNELKLMISLGQFPFVSPFVPLCRTPIKDNLRKNIKLPEETDEFEFILIDLVIEQLPITILLSVATFYVLLNGSFIDHKYHMSKEVLTGFFPSTSEIKILSKSSIEALLSSRSFFLKVTNNLKGKKVSSYKVDVYGSKDFISLNFKSNNKDIIFNTSKAVMNELKKIDDIEIQKEIKYIKKTIQAKEEFIQSIQLLNSSKEILNDDIRRYSEDQKVYDKFYKRDVVNNITGSVSDLARIKLERTSFEISNEERVNELSEEIDRLKFLSEFGFQKVSYLLPVSKESIEKYYPNRLVFIGFSVFLAILYNLIVLNFYFRKYNK